MKILVIGRGLTRKRRERLIQYMDSEISIIGVDAKGYRCAEAEINLVSDDYEKNMKLAKDRGFVII